MSGYSYGEKEPIELCPYCGTECHADYVDVGVGMVQSGPFHCTDCGASEIGPYDKPRILNDQEDACGWYSPGAEPGSSANVIGGKVVDHQTMNAAYRAEFIGNPDYAKLGVVEQWLDEVRKP